MEGTFNERLSQLLKQRQMTQKRLADKAGVTEAAMSHYLKGDRTPRASVLGRIATVLGTTTDYLLTGNDTDSANEVIYAKRLIARNAHQLSREDKLEIMSILISED